MNAVWKQKLFQEKKKKKKELLALLQRQWSEKQGQRSRSRIKGEEEVVFSSSSAGSWEPGLPDCRSKPSLSHRAGTFVSFKRLKGNNKQHSCLQGCSAVAKGPGWEALQKHRSAALRKYNIYRWCQDGGIQWESTRSWQYIPAVDAIKYISPYFS